MIKENTTLFEWNNDIISSILNYLSKERHNKIAQPYSIVGEWGSGKTVLLKRLQEEIKKDLPQYKPIYVDAITLFSVDDLLAYLEPVQEDSPRIVLLVDNIQFYFNRTDIFDNYKLRGKLNKAGAPVLISTANCVLPAFVDYEAAFFEGMKIIYIKPFKKEVFQKFVHPGIDMKRIERLMSYLPQTIRSFLLATKIVAESTNSDMDMDLLKDYYSHFYLIKFEGYVKQIQRILLVMSISKDEVDLKYIREKMGQENGMISPYLKVMVDQKLITRTSTTQRKGRYTISDPLFKFWLKVSYNCEK